MTRFELRKYWLLHTLEAYRDTPPEMPERRFIDRLISVSRRAAGNRPEEKRLHNLAVLRYITDTRPSKLRICEAMHVGRQSYEAITEQAVERLLILAFGVDGIDWNGTPQRESPAAST